MIEGMEDLDPADRKEVAGFVQFLEKWTRFKKAKRARLAAELEFMLAREDFKQAIEDASKSPENSTEMARRDLDD